MGDGIGGAAGAIFLIVAVEVGSVNIVIDVLVGVELFAVGVDGAVVVDRGAPTLSEMGIPVIKKLIVLTPRKSPIDRYATSARNKLLRTTTINFLKSSNKLPGVLACESLVDGGNGKLTGVVFPIG